MIVNYKIHEVSEYINWIYFFHAWGFQPKFAAIADIHGCDSCRAMWLTGFAEEDRPKASEAMQLFKEANRMLNELDTAYQTHGVVNIMDANADGDDLLLNSKRFPLLRQQTAKLKEDDPFLCLSDFVRPLSSGITEQNRSIRHYGRCRNGAALCRRRLQTYVSANIVRQTGGSYCRKTTRRCTQKTLGICT